MLADLPSRDGKPPAPQNHREYAAGYGLGPVILAVYVVIVDRNLAVVCCLLFQRREMPVDSFPHPSVRDIAVK